MKVGSIEYTIDIRKGNSVRDLNDLNTQISNLNNNVRSLDNLNIHSLSNQIDGISAQFNEITNSIYNLSGGIDSYSSSTDNLYNTISRLNGEEDLRLDNLENLNNKNREVTNTLETQKATVIELSDIYNELNNQISNLDLDLKTGDLKDLFNSLSEDSLKLPELSSNYGNLSNSISNTALKLESLNNINKVSSALTTGQILATNSQIAASDELTKSITDQSYSFETLSNSLNSLDLDDKAAKLANLTEETKALNEQLAGLNIDIDLDDDFEAALSLSDELNTNVSTFYMTTEQLQNSFKRVSNEIQGVNNKLAEAKAKTSQLNKEASKSVPSFKNLSKSINNSNTQSNQLGAAIDVFGNKGVKDIAKLTKAFGPMALKLGAIGVAIYAIGKGLKWRAETNFPEVIEETNKLKSNLGELISIPLGKIFDPLIKGWGWFVKRVNRDIDDILNKGYEITIDPEKVKENNKAIIESLKKNNYLDALKIGDLGISAKEASSTFNSLNKAIESYWNGINNLNFDLIIESRRRAVNKLLEDLRNIGFNTQELFKLDEILDPHSLEAFMNSFKLTFKNLKGVIKDLGIVDNKLLNDKDTLLTMESIRKRYQGLYQMEGAENERGSLIKSMSLELQDLGLSLDTANLYANNFFNGFKEQAEQTKDFWDKCKDAWDDLMEEYKKADERIAKGLVDSFNKSTEAIGGSIANLMYQFGELGDLSNMDFGQWARNLVKDVDEVIKELGKLLVIEGIKACIGGNWVLGLGAIAAGCLVSAAAGAIASKFGINKEDNKEVDDSEYQRRKRWIDQNVADEYSYNQYMRALENQWKNVQKGGSWDSYAFPSRDEVYTLANNNQTNYVVLNTPDVYLNRTKVSATLSQGQVYDKAYGVV